MVIVDFLPVVMLCVAWLFFVIGMFLWAGLP